MDIVSKYEVKVLYQTEMIVATELYEDEYEARKIFDALDPFLGASIYLARLDYSHSGRVYLHTKVIDSKRC